MSIPIMITDDENMEIREFDDCDKAAYFLLNRKVEVPAYNQEEGIPNIYHNEENEVFHLNELNNQEKNDIYRKLLNPNIFSRNEYNECNKSNGEIKKMGKFLQKVSGRFFSPMEIINAFEWRLNDNKKEIEVEEVKSFIHAIKAALMRNGHEE